MQVGLSLPFAEWLLPRIKAHFPDFPERTAAELYQAETVMKTPSLIRVEADEVRTGRFPFSECSPGEGGKNPACWPPHKTAE